MRTEENVLFINLETVNDFQNNRLPVVMQGTGSALKYIMEAMFSNCKTGIEKTMRCNA